MLNLGDEPTGVDYSLPADSTFFAATGYHFADVATWAAWPWEATDPAVTVTISFDGGPGRDNQRAPAIEDIFRQAPPNLQPGWSAYPRDGKPTEAVDDSNLTGLSTLLGTLAHFSARYQRPYWLWFSGNSWGLGQGSADPSSIADAMVNIWSLRGFNFGDLVSLVRSGATPAVVGTLAGHDLSGIRLLVVLARD